MASETLIPCGVDQRFRIWQLPRTGFSVPTDLLILLRPPMDMAPRSSNLYGSIVRLNCGSRR
jgi:hypothetical protein